MYKDIKFAIKTTDLNGDTTIASGVIFVPEIADCYDFPLISDQHPTSFRKTDVPSGGLAEYETIGTTYATNGYVVCMADYLGLGDNDLPIHPYLHWESEATACIDLIRACREFLKNELNVSLNGQVFLSGYSQGGHATMAINKYISENNLYDEFNIIASAPMSGPYNLTKLMRDILTAPDSIYSSPEFLCYTFASFQLVYGNIYQSFSDIYKSPYDSIIPTYLDGNHTENQLHSVLPTNMYHYIEDSILQAIIADSIMFSHPINKAINANNVNSWFSENPIKLLYCNADEVVPYTNALLTTESMINAGSANIQSVSISNFLGHTSCALFAYLYTLNWFNSLKTNCIPVKTPVISENKTLKVYPTITSDFISISKKGTEKTYVNIYNSNGKQIISEEFYDLSKDISLTGFAPGIYYVVTHEKNKIPQTTKIIKK